MSSVFTTKEERLIKAALMRFYQEGIAQEMGFGTDADKSAVAWLKKGVKKVQTCSAEKALLYYTEDDDFQDARWSVKALRLPRPLYMKALGVVMSIGGE